MDDVPYMTPYERHVFICTGQFSEVCDPDGQARKLQWHLGNMLGELADYDNPRRVKISTAPCLGVCMRGPIMVVYPDGVWYYNVDEKVLARIVEEHLKNGRPVEEYAFHVLGRETATPAAA